jgi:O-antigen/teichoic acid export membrane protein
MSWRGLLEKLHSKRGRATLIMAFGMAVKLGVQVLSFGLVAAHMGATEFGNFATVVGAVGIVATFAIWGGDQLLIRRVAREPGGFPRALATSFALLAMAGLPLSFAAIAVAPLFVSFSTAMQLVVPVVLSDVIFANVNILVVASYRAVDEPGRASLSNLNFSSARLVAAVAWVMLAPSHDAVSWAGFYCAASALAAVTGVPWMCRRLGRPVWDIDWREVRDGFHFASFQSASAVYANVDKPLVALLSDLTVAGTYAAAYRIAEAAALPVRAIFYAVCSDFFRHGAAGIHRNIKFAVEILPVCIGSGLVGAVGIAIIAPIAPDLLGASYANTGVILLIFTMRPLLAALETLGADILSTSGHAGVRVLMQLGLPVAKVLACLALVPPFGAIGAAAAELLTLAAVSAGSGIAVYLLARREAAEPPAARGAAATEALVPSTPIEPRRVLDQQPV